MRRVFHCPRRKPGILHSKCFIDAERVADLIGESSHRKLSGTRATRRMQPAT